MAVSGCGLREGSTKWAGKRVIRIESVNNVSSNVSGGVSGWSEFRKRETLPLILSYIGNLRK